MSKTNQVQLIGNIGSTPKLVPTSNNSNVLSFSFATHDYFKDEAGNKNNKTEWHNVVAFGNVANLINQYTSQGSYMLIQGRLQTRQYQDKSGNNRYTTEIIAEEIIFLDKPQKE